MSGNPERMHKSTRGSDQQRAQVLVVEDDKRWRDRLAEIFRDMRCDVETTPEYDKARELMRTKRYDLVTLDLDLGNPPGAHDGMLLLDAAIIMGIPAIVITGTRDRQGANQILRKFTVAEVFLKGHFDPSELKRAVEGIIGPVTVATSRDEVKPVKLTESRRQPEARVLIVSNLAQLAARYGRSGLDRLEKELEYYRMSLLKDGLDSDLLYIDRESGPELLAEAENITEFLKSYRHKNEFDYLLIVGGHRTVPFHAIRDQTRDDVFIYSDEPYITFNEDIIAVGRLPEGTDSLIGFIVRQLRVAADFHRENPSITGLLNVAFSAAIWEAASRRVFPETELILCPPHVLSLDANFPGRRKEVDDSMASGKGIVFFNVHGLEKDPLWYGETAINDKAYWPAMFSPAMMGDADVRRTVVLTEACFGAHILGKLVDESIALRYIRAGCPAFIGSTAKVYASLDRIANGDLLAHSFLKHLRTGKKVGDALKQARKEVIHTGALGEKTALEFVLFGDPSIRV